MRERPTISPRHVDWAEFHEHLLATAIERMARVARARGLDGLPTMHNFPLGEEATPLNAARHRPAWSTLVGLDYYHRANARRARDHRAPHDRARGALRKAAAARVRVRDGRRVPAVLLAALDERDNALHRARPRSRTACAASTSTWPSSAIAGSARPSIRTAARARFAAFWRKLCEALERRSSTLVLKAEVRVVVPSLKRRLCRVRHALSSAHPALFAVLGRGAHESCFEEDRA